VDSVLSAAATPADLSATLFGVDFSSSPTPKKPIVVARGVRRGAVVQLLDLQRLPSLDAFTQWLNPTTTPGPWLGVFDLPFGLPQELVEALGWPMTWPELMRHYAGLTRAEIRDAFSAFCAVRPPGGKFAHRACDIPAGSSPSMKWVNPPVAFMLHAGVPRLMDAGVDLPGLMRGDAARVALEGYPGVLARELIGRRSYKADDKARQTPDRLIARKDLIEALEQGRTRLGLRLKLTHAQRDALVAEGAADGLDAVLCLAQAAWAHAQGSGAGSAWGLPVNFPRVEGWIVTTRE
jgi:hypothetical protein